MSSWMNLQLVAIDWLMKIFTQKDKENCKYIEVYANGNMYVQCGFCGAIDACWLPDLVFRQSTKQRWGHFVLDSGLLPN